MFSEVLVVVPSHPLCSARADHVDSFQTGLLAHGCPARVPGRISFAVHNRIGYPSEIGSTNWTER
jgi:hypothetical protein